MRGWPAGNFFSAKPRSEVDAAGRTKPAFFMVHGLPVRHVEPTLQLPQQIPIRNTSDVLSQLDDLITRSDQQPDVPRFAY
jgi:hypothetical protein